jgi:hypothetical protein
MKRTIKSCSWIHYGSELLAILPTLVSKFYFDIVPRELTEAETKKGH